MQYKLQYEDKKFAKDTSLALELGSLLHYVLEQKGKQLINKGVVDYDELIQILYQGTIETDKKTQEAIIGVNQLKQKYFEEWFEKEVNYNDKIKIFEKVLHTEMEDTDWQPYLFEHYFDIVYDNKIRLHGFIDRIDIRKKDNGGYEYRVIDYKSSKKVFREQELPSSLQFGIYALAMLNEFNVLPIEYQYRFILLDEIQYALTKGYENRIVKALDKIFANIKLNQENQKFIPSPSPLCYWCSYCKNNPKAKQYRNECEYYSLWKPNSKTFEVNKRWNDLKTENKRKLIF